MRQKGGEPRGWAVPSATNRAKLASVISPQELGHCRLCHVQRIPLREGHLLPYWAQRGEPPIPMRVHCAACERRLAHDDDYVARLAYAGDRLGLLEHVVPAPGPRPDLRIASLRGFNAAAMARFAASIFWRAHASGDPACAGLALTRGEAEGLRDYLRGARALPARICLTVAALIESEGEADPPWTATHFPRTQTQGDERCHVFATAGLAFVLSAGDTAAGIAGICLACGHDPHVVFTSWSRVPHAVTMTDALLCGVRKSRPGQSIVGA
jgi:hypothetical protein